MLNRQGERFRVRMSLFKENEGKGLRRSMEEKYGNELEGMYGNVLSFLMILYVLIKFF